MIDKTNLDEVDRLGEKIQLLAYSFDRITTRPKHWIQKQK